MTASTGARRIPRGAEVALAFGAGAASFALVAVTVAVAEPDVLVAAVGVICLAAVVAIARRWGVAYAAPAAIASLLAFEATAYLFVAEALTNVAKHARAKHAEVLARIEDGTLVVQVRDDGIGGARPDGSGLLGLADRLAALDGRLRVETPADGGTLVTAAIPISG